MPEQRSAAGHFGRRRWSFIEQANQAEQQHFRTPTPMGEFVCRQVTVIEVLVQIFGAVEIGMPVILPAFPADTHNRRFESTMAVGRPLPCHRDGDCGVGDGAPQEFTRYGRISGGELILGARHNPPGFQDVFSGQHYCNPSKFCIRSRKQLTAQQSISSSPAMISP